MKYISYLICFIFLFLATPAKAQDDRYRVELIVLLHLNHAEKAEEQHWLKDYSDALDFLAPEPEPEPESEESGDEAVTAAGETAEVAQPAENINETGEPPPDEPLFDTPGEEFDPNAVVHIEEMSDAMQDAWRRLRLSGPFRPLQYLAWEQGRDEPFPVLRIHNDDTVLIDDPFADLRDLETLESEEPLPGETAVAESVTEVSTTEEAGEEEEALPDPTLYYALDGTASLLRKRFLHLYLDIRLREAVFDDLAEPQPTIGATTTSSLPEDKPEQPQPTSFLVYALEQNRQVRTGRMEYFDGPVIGVLAYISGVSLPEDEAEE
jgi:hypothetical protein